ncbi:MAG: hypothetical protein GY860_08195 [Desulfobacteraceae bacterium]|nr:hypothetical protein [Desulfobacteraceae bacterium]
MDLFLQERVVNIFSLFHSVDFNLNPSQNKMQNFLQDLRQVIMHTGHGSIESAKVT